MIKNKKKNRNIIVIIIIVLIIIALACFILTKFKQDEKAVINSYSFSEMNLPSLSTIPYDNINDVLESLYIENDKFCGFAGDSYESVDLYTANSIVCIADILPDFDNSILKDKLKFLSDSNLEDFDFLNLTYYIDLCRLLEIDLNYSIINEALNKYYDKTENLFFLDSENDSINIKLIATALVKSVMKDNLSFEIFSVENGIKKAYEDYAFLTENDITLYNSGGDILYCISVFDMKDILDISELSDWFDYWEKIYNEIEIDSTMAALQYSEFLNIARIFEPNYSNEKIKKFYYDLTEQDINETDDFYVLYNALKNIDILDDKKVNQYLSNQIMNIIASDSFVVLKTDVKSTVYGVLLSQNSGFSYDDNKIKNYINQIYNRDMSSESIYERSSNLYYTLILEQLIYNYDVDYNVTYLQEQIDTLLKEMEYSPQSIVSDIISTRRLVEIVSDLQIFDVNLKLTSSQVKKIEKGIKSALNEDILKNSVIINDIFIINEILSLDEISGKTLTEVYNNLTVDGGSKATTESDVAPDIISTFQFYSSFCKMNNFENLKKQKDFVSTLEIEEGIFLPDKSSNEIDLSVITYGNAISVFEYGGDANDKNM